MLGERAAEVRSIYRVGDRVLVKAPFGYCDVVVQAYEFRQGRLWLYGVRFVFAAWFPASDVRRRLAPYHVLGWPGELR